MMRIGYDAKKAVKNLTGIGNYSRRCINAVIAHKPEDNSVYLFSAQKGCPEATGQIDPRAEVVCPTGLLRLTIFRELWRCWLVRHRVRQTAIDIFHGLSNEIPFGINKAGCATVVTIHDLIFLRHPETYGWLARQILKIKTRYACRKADRIIAVSEMTKRDIIHCYGIDPKRITVIYQSIDDIYRHPVSEDVRKKWKEYYHLPDRYLLCVGTIQTRKNQHVLVEALSHLPEDIHLVLVGRPTAYQDAVIQTAKERGVLSRVHILNNVDNEALPAIYQQALVFACLSIFEGFGIPLAEALASGIPVIGATGSCLEEAGGPDSIYLSPTDSTGLAQAVMALLTDEQSTRKRIERGMAYSQRFTDTHLGMALNVLYQELKK